MPYTDTQQCEGCNKLAKLEERIKYASITQDKLDKMFETIITLSVKFEESERRSERNSRILWGVLTAVVAQGVAFILTLLSGYLLRG